MSIFNCDTATIDTSDHRIVSFRELSAPAVIRTELPLTARRAQAVQRDRDEISAILAGDDDRLLLVVGPCSVHDPVAALDYARRLAEMAAGYADRLKIVMRVYFEKPRATIGWKGLINDPNMDGSFDVERGIRIARGLLLDIIDVGLPVGCEFLEPTSPQYVPTPSPGVRSAPGPPSRKCTASWHPACRCRWDSRTAPTATSRSPSTASKPLRHHTISSVPTTSVARLWSRPWAIPIVT